MNPGLIRKALRETWGTTLLVGLILAAVEAILAYVLPTVQRSISHSAMMQFEFIHALVKAMVGVDVTDGIGPEVITAVPWVHPVVLALVWAHGVIFCTRLPAGEVDRGTIDLLLGLPVSRWEVFLAETATWLVSAASIIALAAVGNTLGGWNVEPALRPSLPHLLVILVNLFSMSLAVGAGAWFLSALSDRRGRAIATLFVVLLACFLLNYLAQLWEPAKSVWFLSILRYYRPVPVLQHGGWPTADLAVLLTLAAVLWISAGLIFARRDLCTT